MFGDAVNKTDIAIPTVSMLHSMQSEKLLRKGRSNVPLLRNLIGRQHIVLHILTEPLATSTDAIFQVFDIL